jgi:type II secretory ATPase GspE/PulE/Tfp pilus assembly ATPase PilB-like protein
MSDDNAVDQKMSTTWTESSTSQQNLSLDLLANDLLSKALELRCSDMHIEPEENQVVVRYLSKGETIKQVELPLHVHQELAFCYKVIAGLNIKEQSRPQDIRRPLQIAGDDVDMRVTAIPGEFGETIAVTFKYRQE